MYPDIHIEGGLRSYPQYLRMCLYLLIGGACSAPHMGPSAPTPKPSRGRRKQEPFLQDPGGPHLASFLEAPPPATHPSLCPWPHGPHFGSSCPWFLPKPWASPLASSTPSSHPHHLGPSPPAHCAPVSRQLVTGSGMTPTYEFRVHMWECFSALPNMAHSPGRAASGTWRAPMGTPPASPSNLGPLGPTHPLGSLES